MAARGWGWATGAAAVVMAVGALYSTGRAGAHRGPVARPNPTAHPPEITEFGGVRRVLTEHPVEHLALDTLPPDGAVELLWFQGRSAAATSGGAVVLDAVGSPLRFDGRLRAERLRFQLEGRELANVAQGGDGSFWVATREGSVLHLGPDLAIADSIVPPFDYSHVVADRAGRVWAVRSAEQFSFPFRFGTEPLIAPVGHDDSLAVTARRPQVPLFLHLVNAGRVAFGADGSVFYAPFIRDEIVKLSPAGDTVWVARRGLPHEVLEPKFEIDESGEPVIDYAPVNLGLQLGPDGMLYALSTPGYTNEEGRVDVIDPDSGIVRRTATLPAPLVTLAVDPSGRTYLLDDFVLLTGVAAAEREPLAEFDLAGLHGGRVGLRDFAGRVTLINFWASWCAPCRAEMPALNALADGFADQPFAFVALSDDVEPENAAAFIDEYGFDFPVGLGEGKLRNRYHYIGLPFTVLVDAKGRVVQRWAGFAGDEQVGTIRAVIQTELNRMLDAGETAAAGHGGHQHGGAPPNSPAEEHQHHD